MSAVPGVRSKPERARDAVVAAAMKWRRMKQRCDVPRATERAIEAELEAAVDAFEIAK